MQTELNAERSEGQALDNTRMQLERQNKDLQGKLADLESSLRSRNKNIVATLESKVNNLEIQLDQEAKERQQMSKSIRKSEKRVKELTITVEEERSHTENYKNQVNSLLLLSLSPDNDSCLIYSPWNSHFFRTSILTRFLFYNFLNFKCVSSSMLLRIRSSFCTNFIFNQKHFSKYSSDQKLQALEVDPLFDHLQTESSCVF